MRFKKGQSGNPAGKPKGARDKRTELRALFVPHAKDLVQKAIDLALSGDSTALRLCMDRLVPAIKSKDAPIQIGELDGSMGDQGRTVLAALASGDLTPDEASTVMGTIAAHARIIEIDELEKRIANLEAQNGKAEYAKSE